MRIREHDEQELPQHVSCVDSEVVPQARDRHVLVDLAGHHLAPLRRQLVAVLQRHVLREGDANTLGGGVWGHFY